MRFAYYSLMESNTFDRLISIIGGQYRASDACKVSQPTICRWTKGGLPRTEYSGETDYADRLSLALEAKGHAITAAEIRKLGHPKRVKAEQSSAA